MNSVFSNYLSPYIEEGLLQDLDQSKPENVYEQVRIAYNQGAGIINTTRFFVPYYEGQDPDDYDYELLYEIWRNKDLQNIIIKFNRYIIPEIDTISPSTILVRRKIIESQLEKLVLDGKLSKDNFIKICLNLIETTRNELNFRINTELPF